MPEIMHESVSADAYTGKIKGGKDKTISGTYRSNHGAGDEDLVAVLKLQVCSAVDPGALGVNDIGWVDEPTHTFNSNPNAADAKDSFNFANCNDKWYRIMVDVTSGSGLVRIEYNEWE